MESFTRPLVPPKRKRRDLVFDILHAASVQPEQRADDVAAWASKWQPTPPPPPNHPRKRRRVLRAITGNNCTNTMSAASDDKRDQKAAAEMAEESRGRSLRPRDKGNVLVLGQKTPILPSIEAVAADADPVKKKKNKTKKRTKTKTKTKTEASNIHSVDGFDDTQKGKGIQLTSTTQTVAVKFEPGPLSSSYDYRSRSRSRSRSSSPSKRAIKSTADMVHLSPRIEVVARKKAAGYGYTLEDSVARLWDRCKEQPSIDISKMEHVSSRDLPFVERTLDSALSHAADCFDDNVHESQWITKVIAPILLQLEQTAPFNSPSRAPGNDAIRLLDMWVSLVPQFV